MIYIEIQLFVSANENVSASLFIFFGGLVNHA